MVKLESNRYKVDMDAVHSSVPAALHWPLKKFSGMVSSMPWLPSTKSG